MTARLVRPQLLFDGYRSRLTISVVSSLESIPEEQCADLTAGRTFYASRPWLLAIERLRGGGTAYVVSRDLDGRLLGICPVYWGKASSRGMYEPFSRFLTRSGGAFRESDWLPTYVVGTRAAYACEFPIASWLDPAESKAVLAAMLEAAEEHAAACGAASISSLYLNERGRRQLETILPDENGFFVAGANAILDIRWHRFEDFWAEAKRSQKREIRVFASQGYQIRSQKLADAVETMAELMARLERKYGHDTSPENEARELRTLAATANHLSHALILEHEGRAIGCILLFLWEDTVYARSAGFNYDVTGQAFEYFNLVYYEPIRFAIENGFRHIDLGMGAYQAKLARGARLEPRWGVVASGTATSPLHNPEFAAWNRLRDEAVNRSDCTLLERSQIQ